jgi:hypothetical protein
MKVQHSSDCPCHAGAARGQVAPSTGFFVLSLSLFLVLCGLLRAGVLRFW